MGLISFVKSAGEKLFGANEAKAATADALHKELEKHGLDASGVKISVDGDKVHVSGSAPTTEQAEKIAVALGNTVGVQTVQNEIKPDAPRPNRSSTWSKAATRCGRFPRGSTARATAGNTTSSSRPTGRC
jgi:hypothetical protein